MCAHIGLFYFLTKNKLLNTEILFQDIVADDSIKLDWLFRLSFVTDVVQVCIQKGRGILFIIGRPTVLFLVTNVCYCFFNMQASSDSTRQ